MTDLALSMGMFVLVEVFERPDLDDAAVVFDRDVLVGVNCRDLATLEVDFERFASMAPHLPAHLTRVAESGIASLDHTAAVADLGFGMALVGSALVTAPDPAAAVGDLVGSGRAVAAGVAT